MSRFSYQKRIFLAPLSTGATSYILAEVEKSHGGEEAFGDNFVIIADCHRQVRFEFFLGNRLSRRASLTKINLLIEVLTEFRTALTSEAELIDQESGR